MKLPKVSIIMPTYNVAPYLRFAIESVLAQTYTNWELLIVDDGSTDNSNEIACQFADKDFRISVLRKENGGLSDARNFGLRHAKGEYIHFFDSDDNIMPDFYEKMVNAVLIHDYDFVVCGYYRDQERANGEIISSEMPCEDFSSPILYGDNTLYLFMHYFNYAWNKLFKRSFLITNNLFYQKGLSIIEDKEFMSRVVKHNPRFSFIHYAGYRYQIRKRQTLGNRFSDDLIPCQINGIKLQNSILENYCTDCRQLDRDKGQVSLSAQKWITVCVCDYTNLSFRDKVKLLKDVYSNDAVRDDLCNCITRNTKDRLYKYLFKYKLASMICCMYALKKLFT